ncbi:MAG: EamA family transporter RarD, partial [Paracoccaceae bacterium]
RIGELTRVLRARRTLVLVGLAGLFISLNWFIFILAVQIGLTVEASLGYYIFPLVAVVLGLVAFGERLDRMQALAVLLAGAGVVVLTLGLGAAPVISLILSLSFGIYGLIKKYLDVGPVVSVTGEVAVLLPLAVIWLTGVHFLGWNGVSGREGAYFGADPGVSLLLVFSGVITAGPLILFAFAARRLRMATVGLIQYLNPSLQFLVAVLWFRETFTIWHALCFATIWVALAIYSSAVWHAESRAARAASRSGMLSITDMQARKP